MLLTELHLRTYYRGTNNINEPSLLQSGDLRPSLNHVTGKREKGISVSDVPDVGRYFKHMYLIQGVEVGEGSDGEPLIDPSTAKFVKWITK